MKRCPECGREYDNTMMFCLDDGAELLYGPAKSEPGAVATGFFQFAFCTFHFALASLRLRFLLIASEDVRFC
jgi:hypothetical protein